MNTTRSLILFLALALFGLVLLALSAPTARAADPIILRVTVNGATSGTCGATWASPCGLQHALQTVVFSGGELWVGAGTYTPTRGTDRSASFQVHDGNALYGGFAGGETLRSQRNLTANVTILSGDIGIPGDSSDNSYHVVQIEALNNSIVDGFTVTGGRADDLGNPFVGGSGGGMLLLGSSPTLANLIVSGNWAYYGGGMYKSGTVSIGCFGNPTLTNVTFISNTALSHGGGMFNDCGSPTLTNVTFSDNSAFDGGGMTNVSNSSAMLTNVTFTGNSAENGGGTYDSGSSSILTNVTFSRNLAENGGGMYVVSSSLTTTNVIFSGNSAINGGGMYNDHSHPTVANVTLSSNSAYAGAGMYNDTSSPTLTNATFSSNSATSDGGGMYNVHSSPTLTSVTFMSNTAVVGGGMLNISSTLMLTNVSFSSNSADEDGGGMYNAQSNPTLTNVTFISNTAGTSGGGINNSNSSPGLTNVTFSGNHASQGGGIYNSGSSPTLTNVSFSNNYAAVGGGGMENYQGSPTLTNVTFSGNSAFPYGGYGGAMRNLNGSGPTIRNTIFWGNSAFGGSQIYNDASVSTLSYGVVQGGCPAGSTCTTIITADPRLGPLGYWGGATQTVPLLPGSSAIDAGNDAVCPPTDQRGVPRPQGAHCDIGAFEGVLSQLDLPLIRR